MFRRRLDLGFKSKVVLEWTQRVSGIADRDGKKGTTPLHTRRTPSLLQFPYGKAPAAQEPCR